VAPSIRPGVDPYEVILPRARPHEEWRSSASTRTPSDWEGDAGLPARPLGVQLDHTSTPLHGYGVVGFNVSLDTFISERFTGHSTGLTHTTSLYIGPTPRILNNVVDLY